MASVIFYGAGLYLSRHYDEFVAEVGEPICIVDRDHSKQNTKWRTSRGEIDILSLKKAIQLYLDYEIYLTVSQKFVDSVVSELMANGIKRDRLRVFSSFEYRMGCENLNEIIRMNKQDLSACCQLGFAKFFSFHSAIHTEESVRELVREYLKWRKDTLACIKNGLPSDCDGCPKLRMLSFSKIPVITRIMLGSGFAGSRCNCNCVYCCDYSNIHEPNQQILSTYDIHRILNEEVGGTIREIDLADGEISIHPQRDRLFELIQKNGWAVYADTNAIKYSEQLADALKTAGSCLNVSLDCGTKQTYTAVKGVDSFEKVIEHIKKYRESRCFLHLKYILLPSLNDSVQEMDSFVKIAAALNVNSVYLSQDLNNFSRSEERNGVENMTESKFASYAYLAARVKEANLPLNFSANWFTVDDCIRMNSLCDQ